MGTSRNDSDLKTTFQPIDMVDKKTGQPTDGHKVDEKLGDLGDNRTPKSNVTRLGFGGWSNLR